MAPPRRGPQAAGASGPTGTNVSQSARARQRQLPTAAAAGAAEASGVAVVYGIHAKALPTRCHAGTWPIHAHAAAPGGAAAGAAVAVSVSPGAVGVAAVGAAARAPLLARRRGWRRRRRRRQAGAGGDGAPQGVVHACAAVERQLLEPRHVSRQGHHHGRGQRAVGGVQVGQERQRVGLQERTRVQVPQVSIPKSLTQVNSAARHRRPSVHGRYCSLCPVHYTMPHCILLASTEQHARTSH